MRISIIAVGTRGDVQPLIALGLGLKKAGYGVRIATHSNFRAVVQNLGLEYFPLSLDFEQVLHTKEGKEWLTAGRNIYKTATQLSLLWGVYFDGMFQDIHDACQGADAILFSYLGMGACHIAERYDIPCIGTWPTPVTVMPNPAMTIGIPGPWASLFNGKLGVLAHYATEQLVWNTFGRAQNRWRGLLGLEPIRFPGIMHHFRKRKIPFLYGFSPEVVPHPPEWPEWLQIVGYWILENNLVWEPPAGLSQFLADGPTPFYIGFGSMVLSCPEALGTLAIEALDQVKARGIISTGWTGLSAEELNRTLPDHVYAVDYVAHNWLFPRVRGLVHHGGASTTGAALQAGKPSAVIHFFADQAFWGDRLHALGAGPRPISFQSLTSKRLAKALAELDNHDGLHTRAVELARKLSQEDGVATGVTSISELIGKPHPPESKPRSDQRPGSSPEVRCD